MLQQLLKPHKTNKQKNCFLQEAGENQLHYKVWVSSNLWQNSRETGMSPTLKLCNRASHFPVLASLWFRPMKGFPLSSEPGRQQNSDGKLLTPPLHVPEAGISSKRFCWEVLERAFTQSLAILNIWFDAPQESFNLTINLEKNSLKVTAGKLEGNRFRSLHPEGDTLWD